jgi:hypothetical protein
MKRIALAATVIVISLATGIGAVHAAGTGTFNVVPGTVAAGGDVTVSLCGFAAGNGGYYTISGPSVLLTTFWGPATGSGCLTYVQSTSGWTPGKYKFIGYVTGPTGRNTKLGSVVVSVTS